MLISNNANYFIFTTVKSQPYETHVYQEHVLRGNAALFKCHIPSFVDSFVDVVGWFDEISSKNYLLNNTFGTFCFEN